jgi:phospholipase D-like protein
VFRKMERSGETVSESLPLADLLQERVPTIGYQPPDDVELVSVDEEMDLICCVSPDDGWPVLEEFLDRTQRILTIAMFDLTAPQIVDKFLELAKKKTLRVNLAIERGERGGLHGEKENDIPEADFIANMRKRMKNRFRQAFVDVSGTDRTFASAYHIKVAVRDHEEVWLSSGNMQTTNQPDISPAADDEKTFEPLNRFNRDWHAVIRNDKMADIFEKFILHDLETAEANPAEEIVKGDEALVPVDLVDPAFLEAGKPVRYFKREEFNGTKIKVQPLLTPDNYLAQIIPVIERAKKRLWIQNQSLSLLDPLEKNEPDFLKLFKTIRERQQAGVDVRMIFRVDRRDEDGARATKDLLVKFGLKKDTIRVQERCHTKNVIVDSKVVVLGSHNWTNQGAIVNRDASLIFFREDIAKYYEAIFLYDWETLTREPKPPKPGAKPKPQGGDEAVATTTAVVSVDEIVLGD